MICHAELANPPRLFNFKNEGYHCTLLSAPCLHVYVTRLAPLFLLPHHHHHHHHQKKRTHTHTLTHPPTCPPTHLSTHLPVHPSAFLPTSESTNPPGYPPAHLPAHPPAHSPSCQPFCLSAFTCPFIAMQDYSSAARFFRFFLERSSSSWQIRIKMHSNIRTKWT